MKFTIRLTMALGFALVLTTQSLGQGDPKLGPIVQPIVPDKKIGLPDQAPPDGGNSATPIPKGKSSEESAASQKTEAVQNTGEWMKECLPNDKSQCQAIIRAKSGNQIALVMAIANSSSNGKPQMQMAVPLGAAIQKGVTVKIDDYSSVFPISRCTAQGCLVEGEAPRELIAALKSNESSKKKPGAAIVYATSGQAISLSLPSAGFGKSIVLP